MVCGKAWVKLLVSVTHKSGAVYAVMVYGNAWIKPVNDESLLSLQRLWSADTLLRLCPSQFMKHKNGCQQCPSWCRSLSGGDCVAFGTVSLFPHLLGSRSPPEPLWRQLGIKKDQPTSIVWHPILVVLLSFFILAIAVEFCYCYLCSLR